MICELLVKMETIGVTHVLLNLNLATDLLLHLRFNDLRLLETLESEDIVGLYLGANHVDATHSKS